MTWHGIQVKSHCGLKEQKPILFTMQERRMINREDESVGNDKLLLDRE